jgi:hypothetical protein
MAPIAPAAGRAQAGNGNIGLFDIDIDSDIDIGPGALMASGLSFGPGCSGCHCARVVCR